MYHFSDFSRFWQINSPKMISAMPIHLPQGSISWKKRSIHRAVKAGRILLNALAWVTPTPRKAKQKRMKAITLAKTVR